MEQKIRVFISYSRPDKELVKKLVKVIESDDVSVLWDENLNTGDGFPEQIKDFISYAHIFIPVLTKESLFRGWVHQEIGYAMALHIPVFPLTTDAIEPGGMLQHIQALKIPENEQDLRNLINVSKLKTLLDSSYSSPLYQCANYPEVRTKMITEFADKITFTGNQGIVRQKGGLSSFHIPDKRIEHQVWDDRYYPERKSLNHKALQLGERKALQQHAEKKGCRLIISPDYAIAGRSNLSAKIRLNTLIEFLTNMSDEKVIIAFQENETNKESLTMVGNWFLAESVSFKDGDGFMNTFFTRNATEISKRIDVFDEELSDLLKAADWTAVNSRVKAIEKLKNLIETIQD